MSTTALLVWETINQGNQKDHSMARSRTPTGWLVREIMDVLHDDPNRGGMQSGWEWRTSITFVPDPDGVWLKEGVA